MRISNHTPPQYSNGDLRRLEARDKVTGNAIYTGDLDTEIPGGPLLHAAVVLSQSASGRIEAIHTSEAAAAGGVRAILTHENAPRLKKVKTLTASQIDSFLPLQSNELRFYGQPIAVVIADTLMEAQNAASLIRADYQPEDAPLHFEALLSEAVDPKKIAAGEPSKEGRGNPEQAFSGAAIQIDLTYHSSAAHHNPIEPGACIAAWDHDGRLTVWNATQWVYGDAMALGEAFNFGPLDKKPRLAPQLIAGVSLGGKIRVIAPLVGGAFGSKSTGVTLLLTAMAARLAAAPVKLVLSREQTYSLMPYRSALIQRIRLGADREGRLSATLHDALVQNSLCASFVEPVGELTPHLYACSNLSTTHKIVKLAVNAPGWMRAPGAAPGAFGLECALDELAERTGIDPVELRLRNYAATDPANNHPWSSKSLKECYRQAGEAIGWWTERDPRPSSMQQDGWLVGYGMATSAYLTRQFPTVAHVTLHPDGTAVISTAVHEIGQGAFTALTQVGAESLGLDASRVQLRFGDTDLPFAFITAGSGTMLSAGSAIKEAADRVLRDLILRAVTDKASPLFGFRSHEIQAADGYLFAAKEPSLRESYATLLARHPRRTFRAKAISGRTFGKSRYGRSAFGAQFAKVAVNPDTGQVRVRQMVGAFAGGRIINHITAHSQLLGGMVWGIGHALLEETVFDNRNGNWINSNLAEALVPTNSDVPKLDAILVEEDDSRGSALGAKGLGEIGIVGVAAAILNAVHHATGSRFHEIPLKPDAVLAALAEQNEIASGRFSRS